MMNRPVSLIQNACIDLFADRLNQNLHDTDLLLPTQVWMLLLAMNGTMRTLNELISSLDFDSIVSIIKHDDL